MYKATKNSTAIILLGLTTAFLSPSVAIAEPTTKPALSSSLAYGVETWHWLDASWTGDDRPFETIVTKLDDIGADRVTPSLINGYCSDYIKNKRDPVLGFQFAYALYCIRTPPSKVNFPTIETSYVFANAIDPRTYNYTRLRYLFTEPDEQHAEKLATLGKKLLNVKPDDEDVECHLVDVLEAWKSQENKAAALKYADDLIAKYPSDPKVYGIKAGYIYFYCWTQKYDYEDGDEAIRWYQKFLDLAPPTDPHRETVNRNIGRIRTVRRYQDAHPNWRSDVRPLTNKLKDF